MTKEQRLKELRRYWNLTTELGIDDEARRQVLGVAEKTYERIRAEVLSDKRHEASDYASERIVDSLQGLYNVVVGRRAVTKSQYTRQVVDTLRALRDGDEYVILTGTPLLERSSPEVCTEAVKAARRGASLTYYYPTTKAVEHVANQLRSRLSDDAAKISGWFKTPEGDNELVATLLRNVSEHLAEEHNDPEYKEAVKKRIQFRTLDWWAFVGLREKLVIQREKDGTTNVRLFTFIPTGTSSNPFLFDPEQTWEVQDNPALPLPIDTLLKVLKQSSHVFHP